MDKNRVIQWIIVVGVFGILGYAGQQSWLVVHRDIFIVFLLLLSFITVSLFVFLNRKSS